jgi:hypothetical protein
MSYKIINDQFQNEIENNVVSSIFPSLINEHKKILLTYLLKIIEVIGYLYLNISDENTSDIFYHQIRQNNYKDTIALLLFLLPFIGDDDGSKKALLRTFDELYIKKTKSGTDLDKDEPKYIYTNLQYGRCVRNEKVEELKFSTEHIEHNFYLLLETIVSTSHKNYVNWVDIIPHNLLEYQEKSLYIDTQKIYNDGLFTDWNSVTDWKLDEFTLQNKLKGLYVGDIYNTISNDFFNQIKNVKWMIYDINTADRTFPLIVIFANMFNFNTSHNSLQEDDKKKYIDYWKNIMGYLKSGEDLPIYNYSPDFNYEVGKLIISNDNLKKIFTSLLFFFQKYYSEINGAIEDGYIPSKKWLDIKATNDEKNEEDEEETSDTLIFNDSVKKSLYSLKSEKTLKHIFNYIFECFQKFRQTWYGFKLIKNNQIIDPFSLQILESDNTINKIKVDLTYKNVYNFAKSLTHITYGNKTNNIFIFCGLMWKSMNVETRTKMLAKLNNKNDNTWFNIKTYIYNLYFSRQNVVAVEDDLIKINNLIYEMVTANIIQFVFESLIIRGVLSEFSPKKNYTDDAIMPPNDNKDEKISRNYLLPRILGKTIFNKSGPYWEHAYYYLTGTTYSNIGKYEVTYGKEDKMIDFFEYNSDRGWYLAYALNWIAQIGFFHHYLNNRVLYVTGSTGVGKSTQVPKLLLYALKALDYKNSGSIACTQPRKSPVVKNADIVSKELGVGIKGSNLYHVQYKYSSDKYMPENKTNHLTLKFITDGSLLQEIRDPVFKKFLTQNDNTAKNQIISENIYDIVIVDEAHEHNPYIDMILTSMKYCTYYNNDIKLVIVSATMDDDEPIYRRFYRNINDNKMYPINCQLFENKLDRVNVDRRFHISPPGKTTKFKVTDIYKPNVDPNELILDILSKDTQTGNFLLFQPGFSDIKKSIEYLNEKMPPNVIAMPFYGDLDDDHRKFMESIGEKLINYHIDRNTPFEEVNLDEITNGISNYNKVVIVATNIAEASITIKDLKYVIETGSQKTDTYDYRIRNGVLNTISISESSRLQRRGRVGRMSPGTVYYLYEEESLEGKKSQYGISTQDLKLLLFGRLSDDNNESNILFNGKNDPNLIENIESIEELQKLYQHVPGFFQNFILRQYVTFYPVKQGDGTIVMKPLFLSYKGKSTHYDYINDKRIEFPFNINGGVDKKTLDDEYGNFYIIHPEELNIKRNIKGTIIGLIDSAKNDIAYKDNKIISYKIISFWEYLRDDLFILINPKDLRDVKKTRFGAILNTLIEGYPEFDYKLFKTFFYAYCFGIGEEMLRLMALYFTIGYDIQKLVVTKLVPSKKHGTRQQPEIDKLQNYLKGSKSDSDALINLLDEFHNVMKKYVIDIDPDAPEHRLHAEHIVLTKKFTQFSELKGTELDVLKKELKNNKLEDKDYLSLRAPTDKGIIKLLIEKKIKEKYDIVEKWCKFSGINPEKIKNYVANYIKIKNLFYTTDNKKNRNNVTISEGVKIIKGLSGYALTHMTNKISKATLSFMYGFPYNVAKKIAETPFYISMFDPTLVNVYSIATSTAPGIMPIVYNTVMDQKYANNYVLFLKHDTKNNSMLGLHYVNTESIKYLGHIYTPNFIKSRISKSILIKPNIEEINIIVKRLYGEIVGEMNRDINQYYDSNIWMAYNNIDGRANTFVDNYIKILRNDPDANILTLIGGFKNEFGCNNVDCKLLDFVFCNKLLSSNITK